MFGTFITSLIIAALGGAAAFYSWRQNAMVALISAGVCLVASIIAVITGLASTVAVVFKLLPWLLLALGIESSALSTRSLRVCTTPRLRI